MDNTTYCEICGQQIDTRLFVVKADVPPFGPYCFHPSCFDAAIIQAQSVAGFRHTQYARDCAEVLRREEGIDLYTRQDRPHGFLR